MDENILLDIDRFIEKNYDNIFRDIARLVAVDSVLGEARPDAPFGEGPKKALELALQISEELGLEARNYENIVGGALLGDGDAYLATVTHLDVVPTGEGWSADPFTVRERDGYIIGRGVIDDKGPAVLCLYALKYLKESGIKLRYPIRALMGTNEENGENDVRYYLKNYPAPLFCFTPDAEFPMCNGEKGIFHGTLTSKCAVENVVDIKGGFAPNAVPDKAEAWVRAEGLKSTESVEAEKEKGLWHLTACGIGGHASLPEGTVNAIGVLTNYILDNEIAGTDEARFFRLISRIHENSDGSAAGLAADDGLFEPLTVVGGMIGFEDGRMFQTVDCRYPTNMNAEKIVSILSEQAGDAAEMRKDTDMVPFYMSLDNPAVRVCLETYNRVTGEDAKPFTIGGGTYAREFPNAVSFGPDHTDRLRPAFAGSMHGVDEAACKSEFTEALKIYILTLLELEKIDF